MKRHGSYKKVKNIKSLYIKNFTASNINPSNDCQTAFTNLQMITNHDTFNKITLVPTSYNEDVTIILMLNSGAWCIDSMFNLFRNENLLLDTAAGASLPENNTTHTTPNNSIINLLKYWGRLRQCIIFLCIKYTQRTALYE